jgi:hypothetical protein
LTEEESRRKSARKGSSEALQLPEVHAGSTEDRIDPVTAGPLQAITIHSLMIQMTNTRFNGRSTLHPPP